ncbi:MAG: GHKL domain-containing protein [Gammaproteobacteria bacterium]|nr:GHKL domain-containing protein [Gammaproteobacteria bacterium]
MSAIAAEKNFATASSFERIANQLNRSYHELESRIGELQHELAQSDQERQREHHAKEKLAEKLDVILGVMPVAVIVLDGRGVVAQANAIAENLLGHDLPGQRWINVIRQYFAPTFTDGHEVALKNGRLLSLATQSLTEEPGQIIVLTDQTETRRLQETLNHHRKLSEMGRMTASLAHQIRTPLSAATLYADHLASPQLSEERRVKYAGKIKARLAQLGQQVQDMLIFSRGGVVLDECIDSADLVTRLQHQLEEICEQQHASCVVESDALSGRVRCNQELLTSAFSNLVENAIQACLAQNVKPVLQLSCRLDAHGLLEITLTDNGPGIAPDLQQKVLEPFFTTKSTGTGLGLAVVNAIVTSHGGRFSIDNAAGAGACARINLPLAQQN